MKQWFDRRNTRLQNFDYNTPGAYFITICTENRKCLLSRINRTSILSEPTIDLLPYGKTAAKIINQLDNFYDCLSVNSYVIMPNHIHLLLRVLAVPSGTPTSTKQNNVLSRFVSTFKRFCNKEFGGNIWQTHFYDHIIRDQADYDKHLEYIYENPFGWQSDDLYSDA